MNYCRALFPFKNYLKDLHAVAEKYASCRPVQATPSWNQPFDQHNPWSSNQNPQLDLSYQDNPWGSPSDNPWESPQGAQPLSKFS